MAASDTPNQTSPKVVASGAIGLVFAAVAAGAAVITPEQFDALGAWAPFAFVVITTLLTTGAAWWKTDPLRLNTLTQAQAIAQSMVRNGQVVPEPAPEADRVAGPDHLATERWPDTNKG